MEINISEIKEQLNIQGEDLLTRPVGKIFYETLLNRLKSKNEPIIELNFNGIKTIDFSFADECIARLIEENTQKNHFGDSVFLITNLTSQSAIENLHVALDYYRKICCFVVNDLSEKESVGEKLQNRIGIVSSQRYYILLGSLEERLYETLKYVVEKRETTARVIADVFNLNINTASTRLLKLYQAHLVHRTEEVSSTGRQFIYRSPF